MSRKYYSIMYRKRILKEFSQICLTEWRLNQLIAL